MELRRYVDPLLRCRGLRPTGNQLGSLEQAFPAQSSGQPCRYHQRWTKANRICSQFTWTISTKRSLHFASANSCLPAHRIAVSHQCPWANRPEGKFGPATSFWDWTYPEGLRAHRRLLPKSMIEDVLRGSQIREHVRCSFRLTIDSVCRRLSSCKARPKARMDSRRILQGTARRSPATL